MTNRAIVEAVLACRPTSLLDLGCGEEWPVRTLAGHGIEASGVHASPALIEAARQTGGGRSLKRSYDETIARPNGLGEPFDVITANFALLDDRAEPLLATVASALLAPDGRLLVQTLHPAMIDSAYEDGLRSETFAAMDDRAGS